MRCYAFPYTVYATVLILTDGLRINCGVDISESRRIASSAPALFILVILNLPDTEHGGGARQPKYEYSYEAGRLYGTTEVIRQCTEHEAPLNIFLLLFYANLGPNNVATSPKQWLGPFSWGLPGKTGDFWPRRTWAYEQRSGLTWRFRPCISQPYTDLHLFISL